MSRVRNVARQLLQEYGREPTIEEIAARAGTPVDETRRVTAMSRYPISLDRPVGNSEDSHFGDLLPDTGAENPAVGAAQEMLRNRIAKVLKSLSYREREIIKLRYGLGDGYSYTLEEVGHIFKVTRERIRQIEAKAVRKLQAPARSEELSGFIDGIHGCTAIHGPCSLGGQRPALQAGSVWTLRTRMPPVANGCRLPTCTYVAAGWQPAEKRPQHTARCP
jgi:RNA polymerase sigma factor (sigma-70 family)